MILACYVLRSSVGLAKMQVRGYGRGFRHLQPSSGRFTAREATGSARAYRTCP